MERVKSIAVVGMGYVGLTLSVILAKHGFKVYGVEISKDVAAQLRQGIPHFKENGLQSLLQHQQRLGNLEVLDKMPDAPIDAYIISVGTPLIKESKQPNINYIQYSIADVAKHMKPGALVILRSTVPVGLSRKLVIPKLEELSGLKVGKDFSFVFAPERTIEGKALIELESNSQIIGGFDERSVTLATDLFRRITPTILVVSSIEASEMIKIMDNSYRDVRFAYANELAHICERLGLDAHELVQAANTHYPRNNIPVPSPGVGGACLSKDPHILRYFALEAGYDPQLIRHAREINETMPRHIVHRVKKKLESMHKDLSKAKVLLVGFAFKGNPETSDLRDSTSVWLLNELSQHATNIHGYDPVVEQDELAKLGVTPCTLEDGCKDADVVMILNNHASYTKIDPYELCGKLRKPAIFYDAWRMFPQEVFESQGVHYMGVGR
jgi:UDP-N-acetyl-D-mannosaminuronic acid dehydrogenase